MIFKYKEYEILIIASFIFHYMYKSDLYFICVTDTDYQKRVPFSFLDEIYNRFTSMFSNLKKDAEESSCDSKFKQILQNELVN